MRLKVASRSASSIPILSPHSDILDLFRISGSVTRTTRKRPREGGSWGFGCWTGTLIGTQSLREGFHLRNGCCSDQCGGGRLSGLGFDSVLGIARVFGFELEFEIARVFGSGLEFGIARVFGSDLQFETVHLRLLRTYSLQLPRTPTLNHNP